MRAATRTPLRRLSTAVSTKEVCIVAAVRTPIGGFNGALAALSGPELGGRAITGALAKAGISEDKVEMCYMGNVLSAGLGQAPARQAARAAKLPDSTICTTVNKVCASGTKAIILAAQEIMLGQADVVVAGGFESMTNCPYYLPKARFGARMGNATMVDGVVHDGLWDPYGNSHMGVLAELCADTYSISREMQDAHADESYARSRAAIEANAFADEIVPITIKGRKGDVEVTTDDEPSNTMPVTKARPAFKKEAGTVTAANASTISDGAAAVVLMSRAAAEAHGATVLGTVKGFGDAEQEPDFFTTAPSKAIPKAMAHAGVATGDVDLFEINEAFSVVSVANNQILGLDPAKVNVNGGAVSIGHPIGCSGARIVVTLLSVLKQNGARLGAAGICNGGGGASAVVIEAA